MKPINCSHILHDLRSLFPDLEAVDKCPACHDEPTPTRGMITSLVMHLNDSHKWSREAIADWLETLDHDLTAQVPEGGEGS